jgi:phosphinothricin acetyltransferase
VRHEEIIILPVAADDAAPISRIYNHYVTDSIVTFEEEPVTAAEMRARIEAILSASLPWFVAVDGAEVVGYAYASAWKPRRGYRFSVEVTVYLDPARAHSGIGSKLYAKLLPALASAGFHSAMGGIALPNDASVRLHEKFGFEKVAHFKESGMKFGRWIDVGYWQLLFSSTAPGQDTYRATPAPST